MMDNIYDFAIVGGGCSGLSLAVELVNVVSDRNRIVIIEPRREYVMDRIWCFWDTMPHHFAPAVQHEWRRWKVRHNGREVVHVSSRYPYQYLPADAFYASAFDVISRFPSVELLLGTRAKDITEKGGAVHLLTDQQLVKARVVFDGRNNPRNHVGLGCLLQHYGGQHVRTRLPVFDPGTLTLMDFDVSQRHGIAFVYLLPFSETEALVEPTVFSRFPFDIEVYTDLIRDYLADRFRVHEYEVLFQEQGVIPMTADLAPPPRLSRVVPIGTAAGAVKASTGYGFLAIQQWSRAVVEAVAGGQKVRLPRLRSRLSTFLDRVFLSFLESHPADAPGIFFDLFRRVPADRLVRFLADHPTAGDMAAVVTAMPTVPFIQQAVHVMAAK